MYTTIIKNELTGKVSQLNVDQAFVNITSNIKPLTWMYSLNEDCIRCPYTKFLEIKNTKLAKFSTSRRVFWKFFDKDLGNYAFDNETYICNLSPEAGQFGIYNVNVVNKTHCELSIEKQAVNIYLSLLYVLLIVLGISIIIYIGQNLYQKYIARIRTTNVTQTNSDFNQEVKPVSVKPRLTSLDTFRGIAIALMIFVNSGGGHYWWIEHATWNGLHVADLVFPWFLWIMGVCIPISVKSQMNRNVKKTAAIKNVFYRSLKLFLIGLCLNTVGGSPSFSNIRIMGVLQRFGIAYFFVTSMHILLYKNFICLPQQKFRRIFYDIFLLGSQWFIILVILIIHLGITFWLPVPGCPTGYLGPGGKHDMLFKPNCIGGATGYIDRLIIGESHLYQRSAAKVLYESRPFDPEGIFGCLLTIVHVFLGVQTGLTIIIYTNWLERLKRWLCWSVICGILAAALSFLSQDNGVIPINKNMWSLSFVLATTSLALLLLSVSYVLIDVLNFWTGTPFHYAGMNAIILYVGHSICHMLPWRWRLDTMNTHFILLIENAWCLSLWLLIAYVLYRKRFFYSL